MNIMDTSTWTGWYFLHCGPIHGHWKYRRYSLIRDLAKELPKMAWDQQQKKIDIATSWLKNIRDGFDCECVVGTRTAGAVFCQSCHAKKALEEMGFSSDNDGNQK